MIISTAIHNSQPRYLTMPNLFTDSLKDESLAKDLIAYLEDSQNSTDSLLDITADNVVESKLEVHHHGGTQIGLDYTLDGDSSTNDWFSEKNEMTKRLRSHIPPILEVLNNLLIHNSPIGFIDSWSGFWIRKYTPNPESKYTNPRIHVDFNSTYRERENKRNYSTPDMASLSIALNNGDEYEGGEIVISDGYDHRGNHQFKVLPKLNAGDGIAWDGWTLHGINPVTSGARYTLVIHFQGTLHS